jgi:predicted AAA+ superfamily ATPase
LLENITYLNIRRITENTYYYRTNKGKEIDFVWLDNQNTRHLVQVCFSLSDPSTRKREITSIYQAMEELDLKKCTIVTMDEEEMLKKDGREIRIIPAWKYLLMDN